MKRRFVILHHIVGTSFKRDRNDHYDWMFETSPDPDAGLRTFATSRLPTTSGESVDGVWLPDHRRMYLDYEGPISGDRGRVIRVMAGEYERIVDHIDRWTAHLEAAPARPDLEIWNRKPIVEIGGTAGDGSLTLRDPTNDCKSSAGE